MLYIIPGIKQVYTNDHVVNIPYNINFKTLLNVMYTKDCLKGNMPELGYFMYKPMNDHNTENVHVEDFVLTKFLSVRSISIDYERIIAWSVGESTEKAFKLLEELDNEHFYYNSESRADVSILIGLIQSDVLVAKKPLEFSVDYEEKIETVIHTYFDVDISTYTDDTQQ